MFSTDLQSAAKRDADALIDNAKELTPEHVPILQKSCIGITCMSNTDYDDFLYKQLEE